MNNSDKVVYFAYGSNLLLARLYARTPSIVRLGTGRLPNHRLSFDKPGGDGSGKCGIEKVNTEEYVLGVLYKMDNTEKPILDEIEGVGHGYFDQPVLVATQDRKINAFTYYPSRLDCRQKPYDWYKDFVLLGAKENNFPKKYVSLIEAVECQIDPNQNRRDMNLGIRS